MYSSLPEGTKTLFGREVNYGDFKGKGGFAATNKFELSGGQMQRLAVYARIYLPISGD